MVICFSSVTPDEWEDFSNKNILKAEREKNSAINLRSIIDGILMQTLSDLQAQCEAVNLAFQKRIEETVEAKTKLEEHLAKVSLINMFPCAVYFQFQVLHVVMWNFFSTSMARQVSQKMESLFTSATVAMITIRYLNKLAMILWEHPNQNGRQFFNVHQ